MRTSTQLDHKLFRILLYRRDASELLLEVSTDGFQLPVVSIPPHTRVAEAINEAIEDHWNLDVCCLFPLHDSSATDSPPLYIVEVCCHDTEAPAGTNWFPVTSLEARDFRDTRQFRGAQVAFAKLTQYRSGKLPGVFGKPGWIHTITEWVAAQAAAAGLSLTGKFRQLNASPTFSLICFETNGPALWFKAVGEPNFHEYKLMAKLAGLRSRYFPTVLATKDNWQGWLMLDAEGTHPDDQSPRKTWQRIADSLATLQSETIPHTEDLLRAGCRDLRVRTLLDYLPRVLRIITKLMQQQTVRLPPPLSLEQVDELERKIVAGARTLAALSLPDTLGQSDFSLGNLVVGADCAVFLDWAEAYVGCPFFTLEYLLVLLEKTRPSCSCWQDSLRHVYSNRWHTRLSTPEINDALRATPLLAAYAYVVTLCVSKEKNRANDASFAGYLRSLGRRMYREAQSFAE